MTTDFSGGDINGENYDLLVLIPNKEEKDINENKNKNHEKLAFWKEIIGI